MKRLLICSLLMVSSAHGEVFTWTESKGTRHYTSSVYEIPARDRAKAKTLNLGTEPQTDRGPTSQPAPQLPLQAPRRGRRGWVIAGAAVVTLAAGGVYVATRSSTPAVIPDAHIAAPPVADAHAAVPQVVDASVPVPVDAGSPRDAAAHAHVVAPRTADAGVVVAPAPADAPAAIKPPIDAPPNIDFIRSH